MASDMALGAGVGTIVTLSPVKASGRFQLEFVCFPQRAGVSGLADSAKDKFQNWKDGSQHDSYLGVSLFVSTPIIETLTEPAGAANRNQPVGQETNRPPSAAGSGG
jgi:hypothetical protein